MIPLSDKKVVNLLTSNLVNISLIEFIDCHDQTQGYFHGYALMLTHRIYA